MEPPRDLFAGLELLGSLVIAGVILCAGSLIAGPILFLLARRDRGLRRAARAWPSVTGQVLEARVVDTPRHHYGLTLEEAEARLRHQANLPAGGPERVLAIALGLLDSPLELAAEQILPAEAERDHWPLIIYAYAVNNVRYLNTRVRVQEAKGPTLGGTAYSHNLVKRYPVGGAVTVYYNPANPKDAALIR
jgi:hypothetical protein